MNVKTVLLALLLGSCILPACQPGAEPIPPASPALPTEAPPPSPSTPAPTRTPEPTETLDPTETPAPTRTPLPEGVLFRDDFEGQFQPGWEWENENPDRWTFTDDGWLQIIGETDSLLTGETQRNLLWYPLPAGDFVISVHLKSKPFEDFHQAAIYIYEDPENYITLNRGYCAPCGGNAFYMDYKISGEWGSYKAATQAEDVYLKLESDSQTISGYYATEPGNWTRVGRFGNYFQFQKVGIGVSDVGAANHVVGLFDYFEIALP